MTERDPAAYFASHPRLIGALFTAILLLSSAQPAAAAGSVFIPGP